MEGYSRWLGNTRYAVGKVGQQAVWIACPDCLPEEEWIRGTGGFTYGPTNQACAFCAHAGFEEAA